MARARRETIEHDHRRFARQAALVVRFPMAHRVLGSVRMSRRLRVLVADDDPEILAIVSQVVAQFGADVTNATTERT